MKTSFSENIEQFNILSSEWDGLCFTVVCLFLLKESLFFQGATVAEIKKQYRLLSLKYHPDKGGDEVMFMRIAKAYAA